jgi:putative ABC transport system permease protein
VRFTDLLGLGLSALGQQKVRTVLTTFGVVIGSFVLILSLSIGYGVRETARRELARHDQLRKIRIYTRNRATEDDVPEEELQIKGRMSEARRDRLRQALIRRWYGKRKGTTTAVLTPERLEEIAGLPHVEAVVPDTWLNCRALFDGQRSFVTGMAATPDDQMLRERLVAGTFFSSPTGRNIIIHEYLLFSWGVHDEADVDRILGRKIHLELRPRARSGNQLLSLLRIDQPRLSAVEEDVLEKAVRQMPAALGKLDLAPAEKDILQGLLQKTARPEPTTNLGAIVEEFTITGVLRDQTKEERSSWIWITQTDLDFLLPEQTAEDLLLRILPGPTTGFTSAQVTVDHEDFIQTVEQRLEALGLETFSLAEAVNQVRFNALLISFATAFVALVALLVAGMGITNTMLMSVLERMHEIGVMKAVGARDRDVRRIFLVEGTLVGVVGGLLGLFASWLAAFPADSYARALTQKQTHVKLEESLFVFPWWLTLGVPLFVSLLTMLAAVYPAHRASRINPITALRHE